MYTVTSLWNTVTMIHDIAMVERNWLTTATQPLKAMIVEKIGFYLSTAEGQFQYVMAARRGWSTGFPADPLQFKASKSTVVQSVTIGRRIYEKSLDHDSFGNGHFVGRALVARLNANFTQIGALVPSCAMRWGVYSWWLLDRLLTCSAVSLFSTLINFSVAKHLQISSDFAPEKPKFWNCAQAFLRHLCIIELVVQLPWFSAAAAPAEPTTARWSTLPMK